jgi:hypothetical protein
MNNSSNNNNYNDYENDSIIKKIFLFLITAIIVFGISIFALPGSLYFLMENFEYILLGVVIILSSLVLFSMLNLTFPDNGN